MLLFVKLKQVYYDNSSNIILGLKTKYVVHFYSDFAS